LKTRKKEEYSTRFYCLK